MDLTKEHFSIYFYNGLSEPRCLGHDLSDLRNVILTDSYAGDLTDELLDLIDHTTNFDDLKTELHTYDLFLNPTFEELKQANTAWFAPDQLMTHLEKWLPATNLKRR